MHRFGWSWDGIRLFVSADGSAGGEAGSHTLRSPGTGLRCDGQALLRRLRVGVVGAGGTGSAVFEQLVRLGVGEIVLIDDDEVSPTNLTRIHGSTAADVGEPKVDVLARSAREIDLGTSVEAHRAKVTDRGAFEALRGCDVVFGCTDDNAGRAVLSRLAYHYCTVVIDLGVVISAAEDEVRGLDARVSVMTPGTPACSVEGGSIRTGCAKSSCRRPSAKTLSRRAMPRGSPTPTPPCSPTRR